MRTDKQDLIAGTILIQGSLVRMLEERRHLDVAEVVSEFRDWLSLVPEEQRRRPLYRPMHEMVKRLEAA